MPTITSNLQMQKTGNLFVHLHSIMCIWANANIHHPCPPLKVSCNTSEVLPSPLSPREVQGPHNSHMLPRQLLLVTCSTFSCFFFEESQLFYTLRTKPTLCKEFRQFFTVSWADDQVQVSRTKSQDEFALQSTDELSRMCVSGLSNSFSNNETSSARIS